MIQWLLTVILLAQLKFSSAECPYSNYPSNKYIVVADDNCQQYTVCTIDNSCKIGSELDQDIPTYIYVSAIGNMQFYSLDNLTVANSEQVVVKDMVLPKTVVYLYFNDITSMDLSSVKAMAWPGVKFIQIMSCSNCPISNKINWPPNLETLYISKSELPTIPTGIPPSVKLLALDQNQLTDIEALPEGISYLNLYGNQLTSVINKDWSSLTFLALGQNPLKVFANVKLSSKLQFFECQNCSLNNITIDSDTYDALSALSPWNEDVNRYVGFNLGNAEFETDSAACKAIGGLIKPLFQGRATVSVTACVLSSSSNGAGSDTTTASPSTSATSSSSSTGLIIGVIVGVVVVIGIAIALFMYIRRKNKQNQEQPQQQAYYRINDNPSTAYQPKDTYERNLPTNTIGTGTGRSQGTGASQGTGGRMSVHLDYSTDLDVTLLRHHRLELSDLVVLGNKPLASGAYGEVWRGTYGGQQVAIKRMKSREPRQVQKFIDEIILMSQLDSDYIVKFVGASWTKPIEIECVVEYMDLGDLRSYLINQSPSQFTWDQKYHSIVSILRGLVYLHTYKPPIIHRDLKSRNVLLDTNKGTKLTDFGTSRVAEEDDLMTNGIGTYQWMAPEVIAGTSYSAPADIYSFGIILSEFCTHEVPYAGIRHPETGRLLAQHQLLNEVREGRLHPSFEGENVPLWVRDVAMQCLQLHEHDRPTALELSSILNRIKP